MAEVSVVVTIDRASLGKTPLTYTANPGDGVLGITAFVPASRVARITYMPDNPDIDGSEALAASWQQALLSFGVVTDGATDETAIATAWAELTEAIGQFSYLVTTQVGNAPAEAWSADRGSIALADSSGRTFTDLANLNPVYAITIPVHPIPGA
jgi:hypothetical protein